MNYKQMITESSSKCVGLKQVLKGIEADSIRCVVIASDSDSFIEECVTEAIGTKCVNVLYCPSKKELGELVGIDVSASVVGIA